MTSRSLKLIQRALPVPAPDALAGVLLHSWCELCSSHLHLSFVVDGQLICAEQTESTALEIRNRLVDHADWSPSLAANDAASISPTELCVVVFRIGTRTVGGILTRRFDAERSEIAELADVSARLIEQARINAQPTDSDAIEEHLRDLKLEAMAEFAAGAGHEINNPLATITGRAGLLLQHEQDPDRRRMLETIGGQALRVRDMIGDAMTFARPPLPIKEELKPADEIRLVVERFTPQARRQATNIILQLNDELRIIADREQFRVVVSCLLRNSLEALREDGTVTLQLHETVDGRVASLIVDDTGPGLSETEREHLFDPFFSGRPAGRGLGFGLAKCWRILKLHDGEITATNLPERGMRLETRWPVS